MSDFTLHAVNGDEVEGSSQRHNTYTQNHRCIETLQSCFPNYGILDYSGA
jgi:hypothetical protein